MTTSVVVFTAGMVWVAVVGNPAAPVSVTLAKFHGEGVSPHSSSKVRDERFALSPFLQMIPCVLVAVGVVVGASVAFQIFETESVAVRVMSLVAVVADSVIAMTGASVSIATERFREADLFPAVSTTPTFCPAGRLSEMVRV